MHHGTWDVNFETDSQPRTSDCSTFSTATFLKDDFIPGIHKALSGITISGVVSGLEASGIGSVCYKILDDKGTLIELQIEKLFHLKQLPQRLISHKQLLQQNYSHGDGFFFYATYMLSLN